MQRLESWDTRQLRLYEIDREIKTTAASLDELSALSSISFSGLSPLLSEAAAALAELDFPESLIHGDLTPWNIKLSEQGPVFLDWEDAAWGPAIVSVEIFLAALRLHPELRDSGWLERIRAFYLEAWGPIDRRWEDRRVRRYSRALAVFLSVERLPALLARRAGHLPRKTRRTQAAQKLGRILRNA